MRVTPSTRKASTLDITTSVWRAWRETGSRNDATPFEMASSPVSDEPPLANDRRITMKVAPYSQEGPDAAWGCTSGHPLVAVATQWVAMTWGCSWPSASRM